MASLIDNPDEYFKKIQEAGTEPSEKKEETPEPAPVFESAPAPITSAGPLADVAPAAKVTYEPITEAGPVAEKAPKEKEVKKTEAPSLVANPDEYFKSIAETDGKESEYDSADYLASATKDVDNTTFINKYLDTVNSMAPKDINKFQKLRPDILLPRDTWKKGYDYEKSQPTQILPSKEELAGMIYSKSPEGKIGGLAGSLVNMGKGIADISAHAGFTDAPDQAKLFGDVKSFVAPALALPEEVGYTGAKMLAGGTKLTDWMLMKSDADKEENAYQRHIVDAARDQATKDSHNNIYERFLTSPTAVAGYKAILAAGGPSVEDTMATHPEMTREQAVAYRDSVLDQQAVEYGRQIANDQAPLSEGVQELGTWFTPGGLGMGEFGLLMNTSKYAKGLSKLAESKLLSKAEIGAKRAGEFESAQAKIAADIEKAQKPSLAGATAQGILDAQKKLADFAEANPKLARLGEAALEYAPAGLLGYETFGHEPGGALAGLASVAIGKKLGVGKALSAAPELVADIDKARRLAAGGKVGKYEMAGALPESSAVTRALFGGGRGAFTDKFANAVSDYAMEGVNVSAMGLATGLINSDDPEQLRQSMATGLMYGLGFKTLHKVLGKDGAADARRQKQEDVDNHMTLQSMDPESQQNMAAGADWNNVVNKSQTQLNFAETEAQIARNSGNETAIKEAEEKLRLAQTVHDKNLTANVQTRQAYGREVMKMVTEGHELLNGTMRAGQKNAGIAVLNTQQIYNKLKSRPENAGKTDAQLWETAANADGVYFHNEGSKVTDRKKAGAQEGQFEGVTFDPFKPTVVVNMDKVQERMGTFGKSYYEAMSHELGHALHAVPEFREANRAAEESLFGIERVDLNGNVEVSKPGVFTPAKLLELFQTEYLGNKGYNPEDIRQWADNNGMWDATNNRYNEAKVAEYMKEEIMAGLTGANLMPSVKETGIRHVLDWASLQSQNNIVAAAINKTVGYGGKLPHEMSKDTNTGVTFTPQQLASNKAALQQLRKLNGMLSAPVAGDKSAPSISKLELLANKGLWKRYGQDSGLFKTEMRATVYDAEGKAIGSTIVADPTAKEGSWSHTPEGPKKDSGYGDLPQGVTVPDGGSVRVTREILMGADGQTPQMLTPKEAKQLQATRMGLIRDAVINAYEGEEGGFRSTSADGLSFRGTFTAKQIQALRDLPENIVPKSVKDVILRMNSLVAEKAGKRMFIDYAAMMNDNGRYKAFAPKIYEIVPLSMGLSKDGNFYVVSASVTRLNDKLVAWQQRLPGRLSMWNGDRDAFFRDFSNIYLKNWQEGKPGETGLDPDPAVALQKKSIFADYLNFATKDTAELHDRTTIPRKRGDARDKDMDRIVMSVRADHIRDMMESTNDPLPIDYQKGKFNLLPSKKGLEEGNRSGIDSSVDEYIRNYKYDNQLTPAHGFRPFRDTPEGASKLKEDRLLGGLVDSLREAHRISEQVDEVSAQQAGASEGVTTPAIALRDAEIKAVKEFAVKNGILKDFDAFTREYLSVPAGKEPVRGAEHDVIIGDPVTKRSGAGLNHNYLHYLDRMIAHSLAFPESEPKLSGIQINPRGGSIYIETKQPYLPPTGEQISEEAKRAHMLDRGFYPVSPSSTEATSFYNPETGMHVDDLHGGNIIETPGADGNPQIVVIDPQIRHTTAGRWDTEIRQDVFRNNPELQDRMQDSSALPVARVPKANVRKAPVGRMGFDVANMEEVPQFGAAIEKAKSVLAKPENMPTQFKPAIKREIGANEEFLSMPEEKAAQEALDVSKRPKFGLARDLEEGYPVALRIDIPAFNRTGNYVVTVHEKGTPSKVGEVIGYDNIARVDNPVFMSNETGAEKIYKGESKKFPIATVAGEFNPSRDIPKDINDWTPVGFDPKEHSYFYDKSNDELVLGGDEAVSVGNTVFVKNPVYGDKTTARFKPSAKLDEDYLNSLRFDANPETAQTYVNEAAERAGYDSSRYWYHGTAGNRFNVPKGRRGVAAHVSLNKDEAWNFAESAPSSSSRGETNPDVRTWYLKRGELFDPTNEDHLKKVLESIKPVREKIENQPLSGQWALKDDTYNPKTWKDKIWDFFEDSEIQKFIKDAGFIGYMDRESPRMTWENTENAAIFDPNSLKEAARITHDDQNNVIPLSQRFDTSKPDIRFKPSKKIEGAEEIESAPGFQKALTKGGKWAVYSSNNLLATGKQFETPEAADQAAKVIADANEPLQGIPYSLQEGRTGKWKILDKKGEAAASKTFSDPTEAADYAVALHRESMPLAAVKKFMSKSDRNAVTEAEQRIADMQAKNPEAMPLVVARDGDTGLPKIDLLEDAEGNPVLDEKGKQARGVIYRQVPYRLRQSPLIDAKDDNVAVQQAADLMTPEVQTAMADPSVAKAIGWYKQMRKQLQQYYGANIELFGQLLGATSARTPVDENFKQTIEAARQYSKGAYDALLQRFHEHIVQATEDLASGALQERWEKKNPAKTWNQEKDGADALRMEINKFDEVPVRSNGKKFNANSQKVLHALYGNWLSQTVGPKTPNFAGNLTGRTLRATIDVWAARNLRRLLYDDGTSQWRLLPEQEKGVDSDYNAKGELTGDFPFAQNVYDEVSSRVNMNADDLQALMWFYEKGIWDQNGWTGALGAKKSSFEEEAEKLSLDRYQAGVTAYTHEGEYPNREEFTAGVQEKTRKELRDSIGQRPGVEISRVTHTDGLYGGSVEPSLDVEFSVSRDKDGKPQSIASVIDKLKNIGKEQNQYDTFISQVVDKQHPNARPMVEVGFKNAAKPEEVDAVVKAFRDAGIDGFTLAKDTKGNVIGIRAQYIPEISSRWDEGGREDLLDHEKHGDLSQNWADKARQAVNSLGTQENVSYKNEGYVSTHVYGKEEYDKETSPQDLLGSNVRDQLGRRKRVLEAPTGEGQVSSGDSPD